jgi:hypothetical protein
MRLPVFPLAISAALIFSACQSEKIDNSLIVDPGNDVSYAADVQPIFDASCGGSGCHVGETTNGVNLSTHADATGSIGLQYGAIVISGDGAGSPIIDKIGPGPRQGSRMPLGRGALSTADIATIRAWIDEGAANN